MTALEAPELPQICEEIDDAAWFAEHPRRLFRARARADGTWLVRRQPQGADPDVFLRVWSAAPPPSDEDEPVAAEWVAAACPDWSPRQARAWARKLLKGRQK